MIIVSIFSHLVLKRISSVTTYMFGGIITSAQTDKHLLGIPIKERCKVGLDVEVDLYKLLNVAIHVPCRFGANHLELVDDHFAGGLVRCEAGHVDEYDDRQDDGSCECGDRIETRKRAVHGLNGRATVERRVMVKEGMALWG